jgi:hypothetical protein
MQPPPMSYQPFTKSNEDLPEPIYDQIPPSPTKDEPLPLMSRASSKYKNENILCAVLALVKELDEIELELVKRDVEKKITVMKHRS